MLRSKLNHLTIISLLNKSWRIERFHPIIIDSSGGDSRTHFQGGEVSMQMEGKNSRRAKIRKYIRLVWKKKIGGGLIPLAPPSLSGHPSLHSAQMLPVILEHGMVVVMAIQVHQQLLLYLCLFMLFFNAYTKSFLFFYINSTSNLHELLD